MADLAAAECLKYSVGLSKNKCTCLGLADDANEWTEILRSDSGYYLDDLELSPSLQMPKASLECIDFWTMMAEAREQGIRDFATDFMAKSKIYTSVKMSPYDGVFTDKEKVNQALTGINKTYLVAKYKPLRYVPGAIWEVRKLGLVLNLPGTYTLNIYSSADLYNENIVPTPIQTQAITVATAGVITEVDVEYDLPLWDDGYKKLSYYIAYDRQGAKPYNIKFNCGCTNGTRPWEQHMKGDGIQTDDVATLENVSQGLSDFSYGIYVSGSLTCDGFDWLCRDWNYKTDSFGRVMARLIQLYSIRKLHALILNSRKINAYTLLKPESLVKRITGITAMIEDPIQGGMPFLYNNIPFDATGCWECNTDMEKKRLTRGTKLRRQNGRFVY